MLFRFKIIVFIPLEISIIHFAKSNIWKEPEFWANINSFIIGNEFRIIATVRFNKIVVKEEKIIEKLIIVVVVKRPN